jgi:hypothetical protein
MGDQAPDQRSVRNSAGLAGKQSNLEQHDEQLQGALALPSRADAQVPAACRRGDGVEAGSPREITRRDDRLPQRHQARICDGLAPAGLLARRDNNIDCDRNPGNTARKGLSSNRSCSVLTSFRGTAMAGLAAGSSRSRMTHNGHGHHYSERRNMDIGPVSPA